MAASNLLGSITPLSDTELEQMANRTSLRSYDETYLNIQVPTIKLFANYSICNGQFFKKTDNYKPVATISMFSSLSALAQPRNPSEYQ